MSDLENGRHACDGHTKSDADAASGIATLRARCDAAERERDEALAKLREVEEELSTQADKYHELEKAEWGACMAIDEFKAKLRDSEAACASMRGLLVTCIDEFHETHTPQWWVDFEKITRAALAHPNGAAFLERVGKLVEALEELNESAYEWQKGIILSALAEWRKP